MKMKCSKMNRRVVAGVMTLLLTVSVYAPAVMAEGSSTADFQKKVVAKAPAEIGTETETGALEITIQDAIDLAMKNNDKIHSAELSLESADITTEEGRRKWSNQVTPITEALWLPATMPPCCLPSLSTCRKPTISLQNPCILPILSKNRLWTEKQEHTYTCYGC